MEKTLWLKERKRGIGGSEAAAICGVSPYRTPLQVWEDKRGLTGTQEDNPAMFWGRTLEPIIRQKYSDETGREVLLPTEILTRPEYPFMLGNIDGFTKEPRLVEIKTAGYPTGWGEPGTDEIPLPYIFQVQHYMIITRIPVADIPVLIGGRDFRIYTVEADAELQQMIIEKEAEFWQLVETGVPPAPVNYEDVVRLYRKSEAKQITATEEIEDRLEELKRARRFITTYEEQETQLKKIIMEFMKENDTLLNLEGNPLVTWKTGKEVTRFDMATFKANHKDLYEKYLQTGEPIRRFLVKGEKTNGKPSSK